MKKLTLFCLALIASMGVSAETFLLDGTVANSCTIDSPANGSLTLSGTTITTATTAAATVTNNSAGAFVLAITQPTAFNSKPNSYTGVETLAAEYSITGANEAAGVNTSATLANSGTDTLAVSVSGSGTTPFTAGNYNVAVVISCDAI